MAGLTDRAARLSAYLAWAARQPLVWGDFDCTLGLAARWVEAERGIDPAKPFRGLYVSPLGAARILKAGGGFVVSIGRACEASGLAPTTRCRLGDVGIVRMLGSRNRLRDAMAVRCARRWAVLSPTGLIFAPVDALAAWEV